MKVIINVWNLDKPHELLSGMPMTTILEYDEFDEPEVVGHDILIERCKYDTLHKELVIHLDEFPARIDADPRFKVIHLMHKDRIHFRPNAYTLLDNGKGIILWTNPNIEVEVS